MFKVNWLEGDKQWVDMETLKLYDPYLAVKYAIQNKLTDKPGYEWTKHYLEADKVLTNMVFSYKTSRFLKNIKFGVEVPQSTNHALKIDEIDGTNLWKEAMETEINQLQEYNTFIVLGENEPVPKGYKKIPYHCIYNVKFDGRRKCRLVAGGHMTDPASEDVYSGVVSMETV